MTSAVLHRLFNPKSIALIGASRDPKKLGHITLKNLIEGGFKGKKFPINPKAREVCGIKTYPSITKVPDQVDLSIIAVPAVVVSKAIEDSAKKGVKVAVVLSSGFREAGAQGEVLEQEILRVAKEGGIRLLGPNCLGVVNASASMDATLSRVIDPKGLGRGSIAFISQSGAFGASLYSWAQGKGISFDKLISLGNMCDIGESDILDYLEADVNTKVIVIYMEGVKNGRIFLKTAKKVSAVKPIVVMKIGRSSRGSRAARSHTGALTGLDEIYDAAFKQGGVIRANNTREMFDFAKAFATQPLPKGNRIVIVTNAGGPGVAATDVSQEEELKLAEIDEQTKKILRRILPPFASVLNPIDTTPQVSPKIHGEILEIMLNSDAIDGGISIIVGSRPRGYAEEVVDAHIGIAKRTNKPLLFSWTVDKSAQDLVTKLEEHGVPVYETPEAAVKCIGATRKYAAFLEKHASYST